MPQRPGYGDTAACAAVGATVDPAVITPHEHTTVSGVVTNTCDMPVFLSSGPCAAQGLQAVTVDGPGPGSA